MFSTPPDTECTGTRWQIPTELFWKLVVRQGWKETMHFMSKRQMMAPYVDYLLHNKCFNRHLQILYSHPLRKIISFCTRGRS